VSIFIRTAYLEMVTDEDIQKQWEKIHRLSLAQLKDGGYMIALTSPSNTKVPNVDRFLSRKMTKEEAYEHLANLYRQASKCPTSGNEITQIPHLDKLIPIKRLV
jgi:hypothetical protein